MCCARLAENTGRKNSPKNRHLGTTAQLCRATSSQLRHVLTIGKNFLNINIASICFHEMANFVPPTAEIGSGVWGTLAIFNGFRVLAAVPPLRAALGVLQHPGPQFWVSASGGSGTFLCCYSSVTDPHLAQHPCPH